MWTHLSCPSYLWRKGCFRSFVGVHLSFQSVVSVADQYCQSQADLRQPRLVEEIQHTYETTETLGNYFGMCYIFKYL